MRGCEQPAQPLNDHYMRGWQQAADEGAKTNLDLCNRFTRLGNGLAMTEAAYEEITGDRPDYSDCKPEDAEG